ncbi:MAG: DUF6169 family protein [Bacteroidia bacterium]
MLNHYPLFENDELYYEFITDSGINYRIYFLDYGHILNSYISHTNNIYTFNIDLDGNVSDLGATDERIGLTIVYILKLFFEKIENVIIYVCDSMDDRQLARKRKFDFWFWKYNDVSIIKEDGIAVIESVQILNTLLVNKYNLQLTEIILSFKELNEKMNEK